MSRIIEGTLYERNALPGWFEVRTKKCSGVMERTLRPVYQWDEVGPAPAWMMMPLAEVDPIKDAEWLEDQRQKNLRRAAKRAKLACKWFIVHERFNQMLTLTYRENQTDEKLAKKHHEEWVRRMRRALGGQFRYCTGFEPQERGAWHMHVACHKLPKHVQHKGVKVESWKLGTRIWRDIVGADNGLCFVGGKPSKWGRKARKNMSLYKMANYVSKYITKHFELMPESSNRYSRSNGSMRYGTADDVAQGRAEIVREVQHFPADCIGDLISLVFEVPGGSVVASHRLDVAGSFYMLATETRH